MGSTGQLIGRRITKRRRTHLQRKTGANLASLAHSETPTNSKTISRINRTVTLARSNVTPTLVALHRTKRLALVITNRWLKGNSPITKVVVTLPLISRHTKQPSKGTTLSNRCTNSTKTKSEQVARKANQIWTRRSWRTKRELPSSASRSTGRSRSSSKLSRKTQGVEAQWPLLKHQLRSPSREVFPDSRGVEEIMGNDRVLVLSKSS